MFLLMTEPRSPARRQPRALATRQRLIAAVVELVRAQGYAATSVEQLCAHAGVTKGAFFHHFESKEALARAAADYWGARADELFATPGILDPVERIFAYLDARVAMMTGDLGGASCLAGTLLQEVHASSEPLRAAAGAAVLGHAASLERECDAALTAAGVRWTDGASVARYIQTVVQGSFILAKAAGDATAAREPMAHLRRYLAMIFEREDML